MSAKGCSRDLRAVPHCVLLYFCALNASCVGLDDGRVVLSAMPVRKTGYELMVGQQP